MFFSYQYFFCHEDKTLLSTLKELSELSVFPVWLMGIGSISVCEAQLRFPLTLAGGSFPSLGQFPHTSTNQCSANYLKGILYISQILCSTLSSLKVGTMNPRCLSLPEFLSVSSAQGVCQVQLSRASPLCNFPSAPLSRATTSKLSQDFSLGQ